MLTSADEIFTGFGASAFLPRRRAVQSLDVARDRRELRLQLRAECPAAPGVYGMIDRAGRLIYVGVSRRLRQRLVTYFQGADTFEQPPRRDDHARKELRVGRRAVRLVWEVAGHELLALLREHELIRRFKPDLNVRGRRRRRLAYIVLSTDDAPRFRIAAQLPKLCRHHWGPFAHNGHLIRSVELLNRQFKLPDCPSQTIAHFAGDSLLFPIADRPLCLRGEVDRCLAPCIGAATRRDYFAQLARARAFLDGRDDAPLVELERALSEAVTRRNFEQAARLHEIHTDLETLRDRLLPRPHEEPRSFVYPITRGRRATWLLVCHGTVLAVQNEPRSITAAERWLTRLEELPIATDVAIDDRDAAEPRIVRAWFRQNPAELERVVSYDRAREICREVRHFVATGGIEVAPSATSRTFLHTQERNMTKSNSEPRQPDYNAEKKSPNYRSKNAPRAEQERECHTTAPPAAPSSAAENHKDANQKCETPAPKAASKDEREKATG